MSCHTLKFLQSLITTTLTWTLDDKEVNGSYIKPSHCYSTNIYGSKTLQYKMFTIININIYVYVFLRKWTYRNYLSF